MVLQAGTLTPCGNRRSRRARIFRAPQLGFSRLAARLPLPLAPAIDWHTGNGHILVPASGVPDAGRIVRVVSATGQEPEGLWFLYPEYQEFAGNAPALRDVVAVGGRGISFVSDDEK